MLLSDMMQPNQCGGLCRRTLALGVVGASLGLAPLVAGENASPTNGPATNAAPAAAQTQTMHFPISQYQVLGNTLLPRKILDGILTKHTGTNVTFADVASAVKELQLEYHDRGFDTISVTIPQQRLTNGVFKIQVFEGRLAEIVVTGNRFYSSNNVMRALPGLKTNMFLNSKLLQPQLDLANGNADRQIYPEIHPGPDSNTTLLMLRVKDQLPMHAKIEANNQSTPGTPDLRLATSVAYDNLWQLDHSMGLQYTFSEQAYKKGGDWEPYDQPLVANYSGFYRLPLSTPDSLADEAAGNASKFGYNEATRKFVLPPATGAPELNIYASGSTIDTGVLRGSPTLLATGITNGSGGSLVKQIITQDLTYSYDLGFRLSQPLPQLDGFQSHFQVGLDYKSFKTVSFETDEFIKTTVGTLPNGTPFTNVLAFPDVINPSSKSISYFPLTLRWDASRDDRFGTTAFGLNYSPNLWYSGKQEDVVHITDSPHSSGFWNIVTANASREQLLPRDWRLALRADGQWASEPLISNEQFGAGGVAGVRGYREGEVFGDSGWRVTSELKAPPYRVGFAGKGTSRPLIVRTSFFMDYADTYLSDPEGRRPDTPLWGVGFAGAASLGSHLNGMLSFAWPLLNTPSTEAYQVRIAFALSAQF